MRKHKVYEVIGRKSGMSDLKMKIRFVHATSKEEAKSESLFTFIKAIHIRNDIDPATIVNPMDF